MQQVFADEGLLHVLSQVISSNITLILFTDNITPDHSTTAAMLHQPTFTGYAPITLVPGTWSAPVSGGGLNSTIYPIQSFLVGGVVPASAYGYAILDNGGRLLAAARFDAAPLTKNPGESFRIVPIIGDFSGTL